MFTPLSLLDFSRGVPNFGGASEEDNLDRIVKDAITNTNQIEVEALKIKITQFLNTKPKDQAEKLGQICNPLFDRIELMFANGEKLFITKEQKATLIAKCDYFSSLFAGRMAIDLIFPDIEKADFVKFLDLLETGNDLKYHPIEIDDLIFLGRRLSLKEKDLQRLIFNNNIRIEGFNFTDEDSIDEFVQMYEEWHDSEEYRDAFLKAFSHVDKANNLIDTKTFIKVLSKIKDTKDIKSLNITNKCTTDDLKALLSLVPHATTIVFDKERSLTDEELDLLHNMTSIVFPVMHPSNMALIRFRENNPNLEAVRFFFPNNDFILAIPQFIKSIEIYNSDLLSIPFWENLGAFPNITEIRTDAIMYQKSILAVISNLKILELTNAEEGLNLEILRLITLHGKKLEALLINRINFQSHLENPNFEPLSLKILSVGFNGIDHNKLAQLLSLLPLLEHLELKYPGNFVEPIDQDFFATLATARSLKSLSLQGINWKRNWTSEIVLPNIEVISLINSDFASNLFMDPGSPIENVNNLMKLCPNLKVINLSRKDSSAATPTLIAAYPTLNFVIH